MILFHFTAINRLEAILREGLTRGEIPYTPNEIGNAVWFTTDRSPAGHGLSDAVPVPANIRAQLAKQHGRPIPEDLRWHDKRRVRIEVVIQSRDRLLKPWLPFARKHLERSWMNILTEEGGGKSKAETWYIYLGVVQPSLFRSVCVRGPDNTFAPLSEADRDEARREAVLLKQRGY